MGITENTIKETTLIANHVVGVARWDDVDAGKLYNWAEDWLAAIITEQDAPHWESSELEY